MQLRLNKSLMFTVQIWCKRCTASETAYLRFYQRTGWKEVRCCTNCQESDLKVAENELEGEKARNERLEHELKIQRERPNKVEKALAELDRKFELLEKQAALAKEKQEEEIQLDYEAEQNRLMTAKEDMKDKLESQAKVELQEMKTKAEEYAAEHIKQLERELKMKKQQLRVCKIEERSNHEKRSNEYKNELLGLHHALMDLDLKKFDKIKEIQKKEEQSKQGTDRDKKLLRLECLKELKEQRFEFLTKLHTRCHFNEKIQSEITSEICRPAIALEQHVFNSAL